MYKIKQVPEDFMVWELPKYKLSEGYFSYFWMRKNNYNTLDAVKQIARYLRIPLKYIGFAGTKDKNAITEQVISIRQIDKDKVENLKLKDIILDFIGKGEEPISLGDLEGNRFRITVRNLPPRFPIKSINKIPNFFGPQRFSKNNIEIGKALVKKQFNKAVELIDQYYVKEYIEDHPGDYVGAIRTLPSKLRRIFIHSYQSYIWNKTVEEYIKSNPCKDIDIPLIGFGTEFEEGELSRIIKKIMREEDITLRDFIIRQIPEISSEGAYRKLFVQPKELKISQEKDELNENKFKAIVTFSLPKSCYATVIIDYLFQ